MGMRRRRKRAVAEETGLFDRAVTEILRYEGGLVKHPTDPGGLTKFGISQRAYPRLNIRALTREEAITIYRRDYWTPVRGDRLPPMVAVAVFDAAVNQGRRAAKIMLQQTLGLKADGIIGPLTLRTARRANQPAVLIDYLTRRTLRYARLRTFRQFGRGWMRRLFSVHQFCLSLKEASQ